jgi:formylmethanofuran dehydrogenase subunit E
MKFVGIMDSFHHKEKIKRLRLTKQLLDKGFTKQKLSEYFEVSLETVEGYIQDSKNIEGFESGVIIKENEKVKPESSLHNFTQKTVSTNDFLKDTFIKTDRIKCPLCNEMLKEEGTIKWNEKIKICKDCFNKLDNDALRRLNNISKV